MLSTNRSDFNAKNTSSILGKTFGYMKLTGELLLALSVLKSESVYGLAKNNFGEATHLESSGGPGMPGLNTAMNFNGFQMVVEALISHQIKNNSHIDWTEIFQSMDAEEKDQGQSEYRAVFEQFAIGNGEDLKLVYFYSLVNGFFLENNLDPAMILKVSNIEEHFFGKFKRLDKFGLLEREYVFGKQLLDYQSLRFFWHRFGVEWDARGLDKRIFEEKHPGLLYTSLLPQEFLDDNSVHRRTYGNDIYNDAVFDYIKGSGKFDAILQKFSIDGPKKFRRLFLSPPTDLDAKITKLMIDSYDWSRFADLGTAFDDFEGGFLAMGEGSEYDEMHKLGIYESLGQAEKGFSVQEQQEALGEFMLIKNINDIKKIPLEQRKESFVQILKWNKILDNLGISKDERLSLSMVCLRKDIHKDPARIVSSHKNIVYVPDVSLFYQMQIMHHLYKTVYGDNAPSFATIAAIFDKESRFHPNAVGDGGASIGYMQAYGSTVKSILTRTKDRDLYKTQFRSNISSNGGERFVYDFYSIEDQVRFTYWFLFNAKDYSAKSLSSRMAGFRKYNGLIPNPEAAKAAGWNMKVYYAKQAYPGSVAKKENAYRSWSLEEKNNLVSSLAIYGDINHAGGANRSVFYYPPIGPGAITFMQNTLRGKNTLNITSTVAEQYISEFVRRALYSNPNQNVNLANQFFGLSELEKFQQENNSIASNLGAENVPMICISPYSYYSAQDNSEVDFDGANISIYIGEQVTFFEILRGNVRSGIAYHNLVKSPDEPLYELVKKGNDTWVKVYDEHTGPEGMWTNDYIAQFGDLIFHVDVVNSPMLYHYDMGRYGKYGEIPLYAH